MSKYLVAFAVLALMGQGCLTQPAPESESVTGDDTTMMVPADGIEGINEMIVEDDGVIEDPEKMMDDETDRSDTSARGTEGLNINMASGNFFFDPASISAEPGQEITIHITKNAGFHTFVIDEIKLKEGIKENGTFTFKAPENPGRYAFYCDIGEHRAKGMEGVLIVE